MKLRIRLLVAFTIFLLANEAVLAQKQKEVDELRQYIANARELFEIPGIAVGIFKDGQVVFNEGFGNANVNTGTPVDTKTIFGIASCSKAFTAACLGILADDSLINWDDRVVDHYPEFQLSDPYVSKEMRVQDLVSHRSGLQTFDGDLLWYGTDYSREEVVERIRHRELSYSFRSQYGYQNVMFIAAGELIEKVTGKSWDEFVTEKILSPLGMTSTSTTNSHFTAGMNLAYPHVDGKPLEFLNYDNCGPAASLNTCTDDLLHWVELWLNKGRYGDQQIFSTSQYYKLTAPHTLINAGRAEKIGGTHFFAYGLGWFMFDYEGRKVIQHGGGLPGFHSKVAFVPEDSLGFVIVANQLSGLVEAVYKKILDFYLNDEETDWAGLYREYELKNEEREQMKEKERMEARESDTEFSLELKDYAGSYEDKMYGKALIDFKEGKLWVTLLPSQELFTSELMHWEKDTFKITFKDPFLPSGYITFHTDGKSKVNNFTIDLENPDFHFYKLDFVKID